MNVLTSMLQQLGIDETFFTMLAIFVVTYVVIRMVAVNKLSVGLVERDHRAEGRAEEARSLQEEFLKIQDELKKQLLRARQEASETFVHLKNKATAEQRAILNTARENAAKQIKEARDEVTQILNKEMKQVEGEVSKISKIIVEQLLGGRNNSKAAGASAATEA